MRGNWAEQLHVGRPNGERIKSEHGYVARDVQETSVKGVHTSSALTIVAKEPTGNEQR